MKKLCKSKKKFTDRGKGIMNELEKKIRAAIDHLESAAMLAGDQKYHDARHWVMQASIITDDLFDELQEADDAKDIEDWEDEE
jgi:hypothetical protein